MQHRKLSIALAGIMLAATSFAASADILFQNLGINAPPTTIGSHALTPFDLAAQNAIPNGSLVTDIPGNPSPGILGIAPGITKFPFSQYNGTWGHGYSGPLYAPTTIFNTTYTLNLPPNTRAFYFYAASRDFGVTSITATSDSGTSSGAVAVTTYSAGGPDSANGFAFYSTEGEDISSITISSTQGVILAEFGISTAPDTTCASEGYTGMKLDWCRNVCEKDYTGTQLKTWIRRWMDRYHDLPYCMREDEETPPQEQGKF